MGQYPTPRTVINGDYVPGTPFRNGESCTLCRQRVQVYRRTLYHVPARMLIVLYNIDPFDYSYVPPLCLRYNLPGGDATMSHHWGLIEAQPGERADGSNRVGFWRLTRDGRDFVTDTVDVEKYAFVYNQECLSLGGPVWTIRNALGTRFNYEELMGG